MSTTTTHPVDSSSITQGAGIPDDALDALVAATIPDRDDSAENLSEVGATLPAPTTLSVGADSDRSGSTEPDRYSTENPLALIATAHHHIRAALAAMDALRPCLSDKGQFVADVTHAAAEGIGKLTVPDLYQAGAR